MEEILVLIGILGMLGILSGFVFYRASKIIPYVHSGAKMSAWEANLISESRLDELAESPQAKQVLTVLEDTEYQQYLSEISLEGGVTLDRVEKSLNSYSRSRYEDVLDLVPEEREETIEKVMESIDLQNLKGIVIGIEQDVPEEELEKFILKSPTISEEELEMLTSAESIERLLEYLEGTDYYEPFSEAYEEKYEEEGISSLLRALDKAYYESLWTDIEEKKAQRDILENIIGTKLDLMNIKLIFRLKREDIPPEKIMEFTVPSHRLTNDQLKTMAAAEDIKSVGDALSGTIYNQVIQEGLNQYEETNSLSEFEKVLDEEFLRTARRNSINEPFSLAPILSYIYLMETEIRNLRTIVGLKVEDVESGEIKNNLIRRREIELQSV